MEQLLLSLLSIGYESVKGKLDLSRTISAIPDEKQDTGPVARPQPVDTVGKRMLFVNYFSPPFDRLNRVPKERAVKDHETVYEEDIAPFWADTAVGPDQIHRFYEITENSINYVRNWLANLSENMSLVINGADHETHIF